MRKLSSLWCMHKFDVKHSIPDVHDTTGEHDAMRVIERCNKCGKEKEGIMLYPKGLLENTIKKLKKEGKIK